MHVEVDAAPHVLDDVVGLQLAAPDDDWRDRPDMHPDRHPRVPGRDRGPRPLHRGSGGRAGRRRRHASTSSSVPASTPSPSAGPSSAPRLRIFEVDQPGTQAWKRRRLVELGFGIPDWLRLVPVDFETGESWWDGLAAAGFDPDRPAVVASTGVSMYLTKEATAATLRQLAALAPGSTLAMTFLLPAELVDEADRPGLEASTRGARASGTPFVSFYTPDEMLALARDAGFRDVRHVSAARRSPTATSPVAPTAFARRAAKD